MKTVAQLLKHDFSKGSLYLYDSNGNITYFETSNGYWDKREYDDNGNEIYYENSYGYWDKKEFDTNGNITYFENSNDVIVDNRPKKETCNGKVVEIDGKRYQLKELD